MSFVKNKISNISPQLPSLDIQKKKPKISKLNKQKELLKLVKTKHVRAVPGGYYTGLINDMHKDYENFQKKGKFLQIEYLNPLIQEIKQTSQTIDNIFDEKISEKLQAPITLNSLSIECTLPFEYKILENLSPLLFLIKYTKPSINREIIIRKLIRKIPYNKILDIDDTKDIIYEYFNHYKTHDEITELFHFLNINLLNKFQINEIIIICCYAERYFLQQLAKKHENISFNRSLQERIDFEFLKRKFSQLNLTDNLKSLIQTLEEPKNRY